MSEFPNALPASLARRVAIDGATECWIWTGKRSNRYGLAYVGEGRVRGAHRVVYESVRGPVPKGLELDHLCRNRWCVNPDHLEPVPHHVNVARGAAGKAQAARTHCPQGHAYDEANTYAKPGGGRGCRACRRASGRRHREANVEKARAACRAYYYARKAREG